MTASAGDREKERQTRAGVRSISLENDRHDGMPQSNRSLAACPMWRITEK
jgi:hypothetical protein